MTRRGFLAGVFLLVPAGAGAQTFRPQLPTGLSLTFATERLGGARVLIFGEVRNSTGAPADRVVIKAEGLDDSGRIVSRGRSWVNGPVPPRGSARFELRLSASGAERRYRVEVETFEFATGVPRVESP